MGSFETSEAPGEDRALEQADEEEFVVCPLIKEGELRPRAMD